ncbi:8638_t:CDS:2, partial [Funneliformis geosporum]
GQRPISVIPRFIERFPYNDAFDRVKDDKEDADVTLEDVLKVDWNWPCFDEWFDQIGKKLRKAKIESAQKSKIVPFKVVYFQNAKDFYTTFVELSSYSLIKTLRGILIDDKEILNDAPRIESRDLYHVLEKLHDYASRSLSETVTEDAHNLEVEKVHLNHLIRFIEQEYNQTTKTRERMLKQRVVSYDMLWVFYTPNSDVWYRCDMSGQQIGGVISSTHEKLEFVNNEFKKVFNINIKIIDCDGNGFKRCFVTRKIECFKGEIGFSDLPVVPFKFSKQSTFLEDTIIENGKRFFELALGSHFMNYEGPLLRWRRVNNCMKLEKIRVNGRVMIDLQSFSIMNPEYSMGNALPPNKCDIVLLGENGVYLNEDEIQQKASHLLAPSLVYGFSFALKEWGQFEVLKFSEISFDTEAFSHLVMPDDRKEILEGLVRQYVVPTQMPNGDAMTSFTKPLDPITNKGNGCIFLCYGPPGTGKTLTAESVAEFLKRPLWMLNVHELGMEPAELDQRLVKLLDVAYTWKAVLLLDEADIYLEKRNAADIIRNAMVGVFLRRLEYYQGILFLTTNRVITFDDAICSRINMFFHYPNFNSEERHKVWTNFIRNGKLPLCADDFVKYDLNGREIRNVLQTAQTLAKSQGCNFTAYHVVKVIKTVQGFQKEMNDIRSNGGE